MWSIDNDTNPSPGIVNPNVSILLSVVNLNADVMTDGKRIGFRVFMRNGPTSTQPGKEKLVAGDRQPKKKKKQTGILLVVMASY